MSSLRLPRWTALLALPLLAGALLLMHGLDAGANTVGHSGASTVEATHAHQGETPAEHHDAGCPGCAVGHVMAACVAIVATVIGLRLAQRSAGTHLSTLVATATGSLRAARQLLRPPDPAWVRLAVMRC
jgi:hypothetical protein